MLCGLRNSHQQFKNVTVYLSIKCSWKYNEFKNAEKSKHLYKMLVVKWAVFFFAVRGIISVNNVEMSNNKKSLKAFIGLRVFHVKFCFINLIKHWSFLMKINRNVRTVFTFKNRLSKQQKTMWNFTVVLKASGKI